MILGSKFSLTVPGETPNEDTDGIIRNEPLELSELKHFLLNADVSYKPFSDKYSCTENVTPAYLEKPLTRNFIIY